MEAVPRMPMLFFDLKTTTDSADFKVLKEYIQHAYHENPESYTLEIHSLEALRAKAAHPQHNVDGVNILKKYYCQLNFLKSRFPITREGPIRVTFTWKEAFSSNVGSSRDIRFEQLCIMFNIGSLHSKLGVMDERATSEGLKLACSHFQCAAWAFQQLKELNCPDFQMSFSVISFMVNTCLAQAQECVLKQSLTGNRKSTINAKVAAQIVEFYNIALNALSAISPEQLKYETNCCEVFDVKTHEGWKKYLRFKIHYYKAITLLYQGMQAEDEQKMGERVTYYDAAFDKLTESMNGSKAIAKSDITRNLHDLAMMAEALSFTMDVIEGKRKAARNDNEYVYHEKVPALDSLPELKGRDLVKCMPFSLNDSDISGPDIFEKLIPMRVHEAASLYSEEKAKLLRHMSGKVEALDEELTKFMSSLQLDIIAACHSQERLPQDLVDKCAEMTARPNAIQDITDAMAQLSDSYHDVDAMLEEIKALVSEEEENEKEYQEIMGPRPPSIVATDLKREMNKYLEAHRKAQESNETLHKVMSFHVANLKLLALTPAQLEKHIPPLTEIKTVETEKTVEVLEHLVSKVEEMRHQRDTLLSQLRQDLLNDEITSQLVTRQTDCLETLFESALAKHNIVINLIEKNLQAQPRILNALSSAYTACAPMRTALAEVIQRRNSVLAALRTSHDAYEDLREKTKRGNEFYEKLGNSVSKLLTRVKGTCNVQEEERLGLLKKENKVLPRHKKKAADIAAAKFPPEDSRNPVSQGPKLKDYLAAGGGGYSKTPTTGAYRASVYPGDYAYPGVPAGVRPTPVGSEMNIEVKTDSTMTPSYPGYESNVDNTFNNYPSSSSGYAPTPAQDYNSHTSGYSQDNSGAYGISQYSGNYRITGTSDTANYGGVSNPGYATTNPGYSTANPDHSTTNTTPNSATYTAPSGYAGSIPPNHGTSTTQQPIPETHLQQPTSAYSHSSVLPEASQQYGNYSSHHQMQPSDPTTQYASVSSENHPSYTAGPYSNYYAQGTHYATYNADGINKYTTSSTPYPPQQASQPSSYYPYPTSSTPVTNPTYVHTSSQPTPNTNSFTPSSMSYPSTVSPAPYGYQYPADAYPSPSPSPYRGQYTTQNNGYYDQNNQYATASPQPQYENSASTPQYPYGNSATPLSQYGNSTITPQSNYVNPAQYENSATPATHYTNPTSAEYPNIPSSHSTYGQTYNASSFPTPTPDTLTSHVTPISQAHYSHATSVPLTFSPYTPDFKYPGGSPSYSYNSSYSNAGQPSYLQTQSSAYSPHEAASSAQNYYNLPYGTQTYMLANGNSYVNTTPSTVTSPDPGTPHVLSPSGSQYNTNNSQYTANSQYSTTNTHYNTPSGTLSNFDLLADLDVNITQSPLIPASNHSPAIDLNSQLSNLSLASGVSTSSKSSADVKNYSSAEVNVTNVQPPTVETKPSSEELPAVLSSTSFTAPKPVAPSSDVTLDKEALTLLAQDVESLEKVVESLTTKTLGGPTLLDAKWKELNDLQAKDASLQSISVARCYPMKNRSPDILPYDSTRVELPSTKDDYINASYIRSPAVSSGPPLIVTQAPVAATVADFWSMVWEKNVELVVCLLPDAELDSPVYWPSEKGQDLEVTKLRISLQSRNLRGAWTERILSLQDQEKKLTHVVVHLQLTAWPGSSFPSYPAQFLSLVSESGILYRQQRSLSHHIVVHCSAGIGRSGLFCLVLLALGHINAGRGIPDLVQLAATISACRKNLMRDREHFKFAHQCVLYYTQDLLIKRGVLSRTSFEENRPKTHSRLPSQDLIHSGVGGSSVPYTVDYTGLEDSSSSKKGHSRKSSSSSICSSSNKAEIFSSQVGALDKLSTLSTPQDPLSQIDPLWPIKKEKGAPGQ